MIDDELRLDENQALGLFDTLGTRLSQKESFLGESGTQGTFSIAVSKMCPSGLWMAINCHHIVILVHNDLLVLMT